MLNKVSPQNIGITFVSNMLQVRPVQLVCHESEWLATGDLTDLVYEIVPHLILHSRLHEKRTVWLEVEYSPLPIGNGLRIEEASFHQISILPVLFGKQKVHFT